MPSPERPHDLRETVVERNGYPWVIADFWLPKEEHDSIEFRLWLVGTWDAETKVPELEYDAPAMRGFIKWDGCGHVWFGEDTDGYLHLCGGRSWRDLIAGLEHVRRRCWELHPSDELQKADDA